MLKKNINKHSFKELYEVSKPSPVLNFNKKLALFFSAKSGCTFIVKWFFHQIDHLNAALDYNHFIHKYRMNVYLKSSQFIKSQNNFINTKGKDYLKIKVVRNPFERAVSSYMHFLGMIEDNHPSVSKNFGIGFDKFDYSFDEFLELLKNINVNKCDIHWRQQFQLIERQLKFDHIIKLENSKQELLKLENSYDLKNTIDIDKLIFSGHHSVEKDNINKEEFCGKQAFTFKIKKNRPSYKSFYNNELEERVRTIYKVDFDRYKFNLEYKNSIV